MWLAPGSTHLFGRTTSKPENGERIKFIENKSVSRKHLLITIHPAATGSSFKLHERSKVEVKDGSKIGTLVNGEKIIGGTKELQGNDFTLKLGNYEHLLRLKWCPVVLCHSGGSKSKDAFAAQRPALEAADIKILKDYVSNETTHSVSKKRNTSANLQALVQVKWVVNEGFVNALCEAVKSRGSEYGTALEADFDGNWPKEMHFVPSQGTEPVKRPDNMYQPNPGRADIFSDFMFIFLSTSQYDNLLSVVTSGGGKALLWEVEIGESKLEELVTYVKEAAGHKDAGHFRLSQVTGPGGVVLVRPPGEDDAMRKFVMAAERTIRQRPIEQNELLDVILMLDTTGLRQPSDLPSEDRSPGSDRELSPAPAVRPERPLQRAISVRDSPAAPEARPQTHNQPQLEEPREEQPLNTRPRHRRYITQSRFKSFDDDGFDPSQFSKPTSESPAPSFDEPEPSQAASAQDVDVDEPSHASHQQQSSRKRTIEQVDEEDEQDEEAMYAALLPGRTAMKRHKTEAAARNGDRDAVVAQKIAEHKAQAKKKKTKQLDVIAEIQKRREREQEEFRQNEESLRMALDGVDIRELKDLAQIEEMEVPVRARPVRDTENGRGERWDPSWNGRKNFKKFRPQGSRQDRPRLQRVIVALEEVPRKGQGIGDEYWLQTSHTSKPKSQSQSQSTRTGASRSQQGGAEDGEHEDSTRFRRRVANSREEDAEAARGDTVTAEEIAGQARDDSLQAIAMQASPSQTMRSESQRKTSGKRPAASQGGGPAKKTRQNRIETPREVVSLDGDDDDELKFRRRRR